MSESILILKNISKSYHQANNSLSILKDISLEVKSGDFIAVTGPCLLYTSPSPRDRTRSRMPSSA